MQPDELPWYWKEFSNQGQHSFQNCPRKRRKRVPSSAGPAECAQSRSIVPRALRTRCLFRLPFVVAFDRQRLTASAAMIAALGMIAGKAAMWSPQSIRGLDVPCRSELNAIVRV